MTNTNTPKRSLLYKTMAFNLFLAALLLFAVMVYLLAKVIFGLLLGEGVTIFLSILLSIGTLVSTAANLSGPLCDHLGVGSDG